MNEADQEQHVVKTLIAELEDMDAPKATMTKSFTVLASFSLATDSPRLRTQTP